MNVRRKKEIEDRLKFEKDLGEKLLQNHFNDVNTESGTYLRMYNKVMERVYMLQWVLGESEEKIFN